MRFANSQKDAWEASAKNSLASRAGDSGSVGQGACMDTDTLREEEDGERAADAAATPRRRSSSRESTLCELVCHIIISLFDKNVFVAALLRMTPMNRTVDDSYQYY